MINKFAKTSVVLALLASIGFGASVAQAHNDTVYVVDQRDVVARSGYGLCWRTGYWTPAAAATSAHGCECDKDLLPKEVCEPAAAKAADAAPAGGVKPSGEKITLAADALFDFDKAVLRPEGKAKLDELAASIKGMSLEVLLAVGHTDRIGSDDYNKKLSEKRADAVKEYLISKGLEANRIYSEGKGEKQPVTGDKCNKMGAENGGNKKLVACLQPDRRVDIEVIGYKK